MPTPEPISRAELRRQGLSDDQITRLSRSARLCRLRRGLYAATDDAEAQLRAALLAHAGRQPRVSHLSAARLLGLPEPLTGWPPPELTSTRPPTLRRPDLRIATAPLPTGHLARLRGVPITAPARTVVDCARVLHPRDGLAIADAGLRTRLVQMSALRDVLSFQAGWPGVVSARKSVHLASGRRESPFESWSAWGFSELGVMPDEWQIDVLDGSGAFVARCDAWWPGVAGEADGRSKYRLAAAERGGAGPDELFDVLAAERRREAAIRALNIDVVRWEARDVLSPDRLERLGRRIRDAVRDAETRTIRGTVRSSPR